MANAFNFESVSHWEGLQADYNQPKEGRASGAWTNTVTNDRLRLKLFPKDVSNYDALVLWVYSQKATEAIIAFALFSENEATDGSDYYLYNLTINWEGWREVTIPFSQMKQIREPLGLNNIDFLRIASSGFGCGDPHPETALKFDAMRLMKYDQSGNLVPPLVPIDWRKFDGVALNATLAETGYALLYIRSAAYPLCDEFEKAYLLADQMQRLLQGRSVYFVEVTENPLIAQQLKVFKVPAFVLVRANRLNEVLYINDLTDPSPIIQFLEKLPAVPLVPPYLQ